MSPNLPDRGSVNKNTAILTLNAGSSSLKFALFGDKDPPIAMVKGEIECIDEAPHLVGRNASGGVMLERRWHDGANPSALLQTVLDFVSDQVGPDGLAAVGHRIVHGGPHYVSPAVVSPDVLSKLEALIPLDPLHMPLNLAPIKVIAALRPALAQVACFDTAFHRTIPPLVQTLALPLPIRNLGVRRYGFHGLSYEYISERLKEIRPGLIGRKVIVAHLGAGASLCALEDGISVATTMGFTTLDGLMMATRCGDLDPGVILHLARHGLSIDDIEAMLYRRSGLLGVSGISGDMRVLAASINPQAREAIDLFVYRLVRDIGAMATALGGFDGLVFTAGIGQHAHDIRAAVCKRLAWLGVCVDEAANVSGATRISTSDSTVEILVIATDEEAMIARHTLKTMKSTLGPIAVAT